MSYVPPHKRHTSGSTQQTPTPEKLAPLFRTNLNLGPRTPSNRSLKHHVYADNAVDRWFAVGLDNDDGNLPPSVRLLPVTVNALERKGIKPLALVNSCFLGDGGRDDLKKPWMYIAERVLQDLLPSFEYIRSEIKSGTLLDIRPLLVARVGKVFFQGNYKPMDETPKDLVTEECLRQMHRMFYTSVPSSFSENIVNTVVPMINFNFEGLEDLYRITLSDKSRPHSNISCKCRIMKEDNSLEVDQIDFTPICQMACDISCLNKNLDLRIMLYGKRDLTDLTDEEQEMINKLIKSAIIDPNVKGGLKWPLGKDSCGDRYRVVKIWHTNSRIYSSPVMKLEVRDADWFDVRSLVGVVTQEINLKLDGLSSKLMEKKIEDAEVLDMLADAMKLLWEKFLTSSTDS